MNVLYYLYGGFQFYFLQYSVVISACILTCTIESSSHSYTCTCSYLAITTCIFSVLIQVLQCILIIIDYFFFIQFCLYSNDL